MIPAWIHAQDLNDRQSLVVKFTCQRCGVERVINIVSAEQYVLFGVAFTNVHSKCKETVQREEQNEL